MLHLTEVGIWMEPDYPYFLPQDSEPWPEQYPFSPSVPMEYPRFTEDEVGFTPADDTAERSPGKNPGDNLPETIISQARKGEAEEIFSGGPLETGEKDDFPLELPSWAIIPGLPITNPHHSSPWASPSLAIFPSLLHDKVGDCISFFQIQADTFFARSLGRSTAYADMMKRIFREKDLPEELFYLALIESGFNP